MKSVACAAVSILALVISMPAMAQTTEEEVSDGLDDIIVTAQRRSQNLQDIPVTVSALTADMLAQRQILETIDLARSIPNMVTANNVLLGTSVTYFLRGSGSTESIATFDLPVGTYVDEVYIARQNANQIALSGIERIEVLRGPQGTLFGRNTTAGAVSIISRKPNDRLSFEGEASYGSFSRRAVQGAVNVPVADGFMIRASAFMVEDDGWLRNPGTENLNSESSWGGRLAARILPTEGVTWDLSAQWISAEITAMGVPGVIRSGPAGPFTVFPVSATGDLLQGRYIDRTCEPQGAIQSWPTQGCLFNGAESTLLISNLSIDTGFGNLSFITGYSRIEQRFNLDVFANTNQPVFGGIFGPNYYLSNSGLHTQFTQEVKLVGETLDGKLEYVAGLFYLKEDNNTALIDTLDPLFLPGAGPLPFGDRVIGNGTRSYAVYGQIDYELVPRLSVQLGGRYTTETKDFAVNGQVLFAPLVTADLVAAGIPLELNVNRFTPRVALQFEVTDDMLLFASFTRGFKSGGWNARALAARGFVAFDPEYVTSWELGAKSDFWDGRARVNATLYRAEYSDLQVPSILPGLTDFVTVNAASALVQGLEVEATIQPVEGLTFYGNLGLTDSKYQQLTAAAIAASLGPKLQRTPDVTAQVGFVGRLPVVGGHAVSLAADIHYTSSFETGPANTLAGRVGGQATVNSQLSWDLPGERWQLFLACKNCTDNVFVVQELLGQIYTNEPRRVTAGVRFRY